MQAPPPYSEQPPIDQTNRMVPLNYCEKMQKYKPQGNSLAGGLMILMSTGMFMGWIISGTALVEDWSQSLSKGLVVLTLSLFLICAIVGSMVGAYIVERMSKKTIYISGGITIVVCCIIVAGWGDEWSAILFSQSVLGFVHGIIHLTCLIHASENSHKVIRGMITGSVTLCYIMGVTIGAMVYSIGGVVPEFMPELYMGIIGIFYGLLGLLIMFCLHYESNVYLIQRGHDVQCQSNMAKMACENSVTWQIVEEFNELKQMVQEDSVENENILKDNNCRPLLITLLMRTLSVFSMGALTTNIMLVIGINLIDLDGFEYVTMLLLISVRMTMSVFALMFVDYLGRKTLILISGIVGGIVMLLLGITYAVETISPTFGVFLAFVYQIACGLGMDMVPDINAAESFGLAKKAWSIAVTNQWQFLVHIVFLIVQFNVEWDRAANSAFMFVNAIITLGITLVVFRLMPEAKNTSLRESRDLFRAKQSFFQHPRNIFNGPSVNQPKRDQF